jgi:hypothetical protein
MAHTEGSFVRWQSTTIAQLGNAVALILSLAGASIAFALALVRDREYHPGPWGKGFIVASGIFLVVSLGLGLWFVINRVRDFRQTTEIVRDREKWQVEGITKSEIDNRLHNSRKHAKRLGERTWALFYWQVVTFGSGVASLIVAFALAYRTRLF